MILIIAISISVIILLRLFYRKLIFNSINFNLLRINILLVCKLLVFKMIILGIIIGFNFYKFTLFENKIGLFLMSFLFINIIYKFIYKKIVTIIFDYEMYIEKSIIEMLQIFAKWYFELYEIKIVFETIEENFHKCYFFLSGLIIITMSRTAAKQRCSN